MQTPPTWPPSRRRKLSSPSPEQAAPFKPWAQVYAYLREHFEQGDHVAIIGPTGTGKTHMALEIAELRSYVIVVACKPKDPLIDDATSRGYYLVPGNKLEIPYVDGKPLHRKVVYWPKLPAEQARQLPSHHLLAAEKAVQKPLVGGALGYVRNKGHWAIVIDEGTYVCRDLNLQRDVDMALFQFRTLASSVVVLGQRPAWMGKYVLSQPTHVFLFHTADRNDRKALGEISGVDSKLVEGIVMGLQRQKHECLYIDTRNHQMMRTIAPAR